MEEVEVKTGKWVSSGASGGGVQSPAFVFGGSF
jgi:hypothetical protein